MDGCRVEIETSVETAGDCVRTGIAGIPLGSKLVQLATRMLEQAYAELVIRSANTWITN